MVIVSIDLAANEKNETGIAILNNHIRTLTLNTDEEIMALAKKTKPKLIGIDAPLSLPHGRKSIDERDSNHFRECDLQLRKLKIRFFPVTLGEMRKLTKRGMDLKKKLEKLGFKVLEIFPGASFDILKLPRKNVEATNEFLGCKAENIHESDAAIGAVTLWLYSKGHGNLLSGKDGEILIPAESALDFYKKSFHID